MLRRNESLSIADNRQHRGGEELADYASDLGSTADECAQQQPMLSPVRALEKNVPSPESFIGPDIITGLRYRPLSQRSALSSRAGILCVGNRQRSKR